MAADYRIVASVQKGIMTKRGFVATGVNTWEAGFIVDSFEKAASPDIWTKLRECFNTEKVKEHLEDD